MGMFLSDTAFGTVEAKMGKKGSSLKWLRTSKSDLEHTALSISVVRHIGQLGSLKSRVHSSTTLQT